MIYKFFDKKKSDDAAENENMSNQRPLDLDEELHKPIIRKFERKKLHSSFIDNISGAELADMHLITKFNKGICLLLCVIDIFGKYA